MSFHVIPSRCVIVVLLSLLIHSPAAHGQGPPGGPPPANVRVAEVRFEEVREMRLITGQVEPARRSVVTSQERGQVTVSPPEPGTAVKQGQVIAQLDDKLLTIERDALAAAVEEAKSNIAEREAQYQLAQRDRSRIEQLVQSNVAREKELEDARDQEAAASARVSLARALVTIAESRLAGINQQIVNMKIVSPFDGFVVRKLTEVGQWIDPGNGVAEVVMISGVKVRLDVPESMAAHIPLDEPLTLEIVGPNLTRNAKVFSIVPDADPQARTFRVLFKIDNADAALMPGHSARAHLPTGLTTQALTVPKDAVQLTPTGTAVYVNRGGVAQQVPVLVRFPTGDRFVVDAMLRSGDQVVIEGNERLFPGQPLNIASPTPPAPAASPAASPAAPPSSSSSTSK
jgi:RND family efflux transporter MFP subunit